MARSRDSRVSRVPLALRRVALRLSSAFYRFPLEGKEGWPVDLWVGDAEKGKHLSNRRFILADCDISFSRRMAWYAREATPDWLRELHAFGWMRDFVAAQPLLPCGKRLRHLVEDWLNCRSSLHEAAFEPAVMGERLSHWVAYAPYYTQNAPPSSQRRILRHMQSEFLVLYQLALRGKRSGFSALKGGMLASIALPGCRFAYPLLERRLDEYIRWLFEGEGRLLERSATELHRILRGLLEISAAQGVSALPDNANVRRAIEKLAAGLDTLRHGDGGVIVFNGSLAGAGDVIDETLRIAAVSLADAEKPSCVEAHGYARITAGESRVFMDVTAPSTYAEKPFRGLQSFEWSYGTDRVVVNCGAYIGADAGWKSAVRLSAAHSVLSPCAADNGGASPQAAHRHAIRDGYAFLESTASNYLAVNGLNYQRQLLINDAGTRFSGADSLQLEVGAGFHSPIDVHLRFHLHPDVKVKRLMNGLVLLQLEGEESGEWTFQSSVGQAVELDDSIYLGIGGKPITSKQIVIYAPLLPDVHSPRMNWSVEWSFIKN